ncbi:MAG: hypothetical protein MJ252_03275 [archaeon]|nr:hypothetical protein [archaeon]
MMNIMKMKQMITLETIMLLLKKQKIKKEIKEEKIKQKEINLRLKKEKILRIQRIILKK